HPVSAVSTEGLNGAEFTFFVPFSERFDMDAKYIGGFTDAQQFRAIHSSRSIPCSGTGRASSRSASGTPLRRVLLQNRRGWGGQCHLPSLTRSWSLGRFFGSTWSCSFLI